MKWCISKDGKIFSVKKIFHGANSIIVEQYTAQPWFRKPLLSSSLEIMKLKINNSITQEISVDYVDRKCIAIVTGNDYICYPLIHC